VKSADLTEIDDDESEPASVPEGKNPERPVPKAPNANPPENSPVLGVTPGEFPSKGTYFRLVYSDYKCDKADN